MVNLKFAFNGYEAGKQESLFKKLKNVIDYVII